MYTGYHSVMFPGKEFVQKTKRKKRKKKKKEKKAKGGMEFAWTIINTEDLAWGP